MQRRIARRQAVSALYKGGRLRAIFGGYRACFLKETQTLYREHNINIMKNQAPSFALFWFAGGGAIGLSAMPQWLRIRVSIWPKASFKLPLQRLWVRAVPIGFSSS